jgi:phenylpyruvate tautomerase PptA (4-oxalocrotonate tautomerase family)
VPHVNIKYFPVEVDGERMATLANDLTSAVVAALGCDAGVVSIALEPVDPREWTERVYDPEIVGRRELLIKVPKY